MMLGCGLVRTFIPGAVELNVRMNSHLQRVRAAALKVRIHSHLQNTLTASATSCHLVGLCIRRMGGGDKVIHGAGEIGDEPAGI